MLQSRRSEPEPVKQKLCETWSRSQNYPFNKYRYLLKSVWRLIRRRKTNFYPYWYSTAVIEQFEVVIQYMAGAGTGTEIINKSGAEKVTEPKINKLDSSTQQKI